MSPERRSNGLRAAERRRWVGAGPAAVPGSAVQGAGPGYLLTARDRDGPASAGCAAAAGGGSWCAQAVVPGLPPWSEDACPAPSTRNVRRILRAARRRRSSTALTLRSVRQDQAERMARRVEEDAERLARLHGVPAGAERDD